MASLGRFGTPHQMVPLDDPDTFEWFDSKVRIVDDVNQVELVDMMVSVRGFSTEGLAALAAVKDVLRIVIHPDDFDEFWVKAKENRQTTEELSDLFMVLLAGATDRPTRRPSESSTGRLPTVENLPAVSYLPVSAGRPDLQILVEDSAADRARIMSKVVG